MHLIEHFPTRALLLLAPWALTAGCSEEPPPASFSVRDSAGVSIAVNGPISAIPARWTLSRRPRFRTGWYDHEPTFENIWTGRFTDRGSVVVGDQFASAYWEFDPGGDVLATWGKRGDGPGELQGVASVFPDGDSVFVQSEMSDRLSTFTREGFERSITVPDRRGDIFGLTAGGDILLRPGSWRRVVDPAKRWVDNAVLRVDRDGSTVDTILAYPLHQSWLGEWLYDPFEPFGWVDASRTDLVFGRSDRPEVRWYDMNGALHRIARWTPDPQPVDEDAWTAYSTSYQGLSSPEIDHSRTEQMLRDLRPAASETLPLFKTIFVDDAGNVWIGQYEIGWEALERFFVMSPEGRWVTTVEMPDRFTLLDVSADAILGVEKDDWDVQAVSVYEIRKPR